MLQSDSSQLQFINNPIFQSDLQKNIGKLTPASAATGFPKRLNSDSRSLILLLIRD